ncbi:MAG: TatD DNase family protein [Phycisphaerales bacterium]
MIDTHCHLTFPDFAGRIDEVLAEARAASVVGCISISTTSVDCEEALRIAQQHDTVWCTAGVHPLYADKGPHLWSAIRAVGEHPECVAWGELGLDNHYDTPDPTTQREVLAEQLAYLESWKSQGLDKPIVIHCREAFDDLIPILGATAFSPDRFVFHCFTGTPDEARKILDFGAMISYTGVVTYKNAAGVAEAAALTPLDRIMCETDAPFLAPAPHRGKRPCVPAWSRHTAEFIAALKGLSFAEFETHLDANTERFFGIRVAAAGASS